RQADHRRSRLEPAVGTVRDGKWDAKVVAMEGQSLILPTARDDEGQNAQEQVEHEAVDRPVRAWQPTGPHEHLPRRTLDRQEQVADEMIGSEVTQEESRETQVKIRGLALRTKRPAKQEQTKHRDRQGIAAEQG